MSGATLTKKTDKRLRLVASVTLGVVGLASGVQSWSHLTHLAEMAGISPSLAWLFALTTDGLVLAGLVAVLHSTLSGKRSAFAWFLVLLGSGVSVFGNAAAAQEVSTGALSGSLTTQVLVFSFPALVLVLTTEAFCVLLRGALVEQAVAEVQEAEALVKEERKAAAKAAREAAAQSQAGDTDRVSVYVAALAFVPDGSALTVKAQALLRAHEQMFGSARVRLADVAEALGVEPKVAAKAVERARIKSRAAAPVQVSAEPASVVRERALAAV